MSNYDDKDYMTEDYGQRRRIAVINGSNMNMLGIREIVHYGTQKLEDIEKKLKKLEPELQCNLVFFQSNHEGDIVDFIQNNIHKLDGGVINPAAFTKTGYSILDALTAIEIPFIEVHLSNIFSREPWHAESVFSSSAVGVITGFRGLTYELGLRGIIDHINIHNK